MKLITLQHKIVLELMEKHNGVFKCFKESNFFKKYKSDYKLIRSLLGLRTGVQCVIPIFTFSKIEGDSLLDDLDDILFNKYCKLMHMEKNYINLNDYVLLELEVPNEFIIMTDFYEWCGYISGMQNDLMKVIVDEKDETYTVQCCIPEIRKSWIRNVYKINGKHLSIQ